MNKDVCRRVQLMINHFFNGNKTKFAERVGVVPQSVNTWLNKGIIGKVTLQRISDAFPEVDKNWLYFGEGEMLVADNIQPSAPPAEENPEDISIAACFMLLKEYMKKFSVLEAQIKQTDEEIAHLRKLIEKNLK